MNLDLQIEKANLILSEFIIHIKQNSPTIKQRGINIEINNNKLK